MRAGLVTEVVQHDQLLPAARQIATSIVGNNQDAVRTLLASYHRIDESQTSEGLWLEAMAARQFRTSGDNITANREAYCNAGVPKSVSGELAATEFAVGEYQQDFLSPATVIVNTIPLTSRNHCARQEERCGVPPGSAHRCWVS